MKKSLLRRIPLLALTLTFAASAFAASGRVTLAQDTTVNGTKLAAGDYKVSYEEGSGEVKVTFKQGKKEVTAPATLEQTKNRPSNSLVGVNTQNGSRELRSLQLAGQNAALMFGEGASRGQSSSQ